MSTNPQCKVEPAQGQDPVAGRELFRRFAARVAHGAGSGWAFVGAMGFLVIWACSYPWFRGPEGFNTWQLIINTATTIVTFLMVFLIQNTQNRDAKALHLKLDELIRAMQGARNRLVELENCSDDELETLHKEFERVHREAARRKTGSAGTASDEDVAGGPAQ